MSRRLGADLVRASGNLALRDLGIARATMLPEAASLPEQSCVVSVLASVSHASGGQLTQERMSADVPIPDVGLLTDEVAVRRNDEVRRQRRDEALESSIAD
jgi:hypothetical protein